MDPEAEKVRLAAKLWTEADRLKVEALVEDWWDREWGTWDLAPTDQSASYVNVRAILLLGIEWCEAFPEWHW